MIHYYGYRVEVVRNGARYTDLDFIDKPTIDARMSAQVKMSFSGTFRYDPAVDYLTDRLRLYLSVDGAEQPVGDFCVATTSRSTTDTGGDRIKVEAYDLGYLLQSAKLEQSLFYTTGTGYLEPVKELLLRAGLALMVETPTAETLTTAREWGIGTTYLEIINELLEEIGYQQIWFNARGFAILAPEQEPVAANIVHQYGPELVPVRLAADREVDAWDAPNVFVLICDNPELDAPLVARSENNNPVSGLSILRRGRRIVQITKVKNTPSQAALQELADRMCQESILRTEVATIATPPEAGHGIGDVVAVDHPLVSGIWRETGWSISPRGGMQHTLQRMILV